MNNIECKVKYVIFDLDDTLYNEKEYVKSAFRNVAEYLFEEHLINKDEVYSKMIELLESDGRGKIFDYIIEEYGIDEEVQKLVEVYRDTMPEIELYGDARECLDILTERGIKTAIITDGCSKVQHRKIESLRLEDKIDFIIVTDDLKDAAKPSIIPFEKVKEYFGIEDAGSSIYIGDNPKKDFIGARNVGMQTARIIRPEGMYMQIQSEEGFEADRDIRNLVELCDIIGV